MFIFLCFNITHIPTSSRFCLFFGYGGWYAAISGAKVRIFSYTAKYFPLLNAV